MSYQVIARKYRPQRFADVVGQEHVTVTLTHAIEQKRIAHAYLFCGPRGTGKTTIARIFAKSLNCTGGPKVDFDDKDARCIEITEGRSLDVLEIDGASNNGVEQVRELRETCKYAPANSAFKIYIIDEVHMLSTAAFNALLKTLEEPPAHVKFMFATTDPEKVLPTILSRCQRFDLRRIPAALIVKHLAHIAGLEKVKIGQPALYAIARGADGGMRDAESTLDQLISFCGETIEESDVLSMFGLAAQGQILALSRAVLEGDVQTALSQLNELAQNGKEFGRLLSDLLNHFRNVLIYQVSRGDLNLLEISEAETTALKEQAALASPERITRIMEIFTDSEIRLRDAASKRILLEVTLLKAIDSKNSLSLDAVLKQLQQLRTQGGGGSPASTPAFIGAPAEARVSGLATPTQKTAAPAITAPPASAPTASVSASATDSPTGQSDLEGLWARLLDGVGRVSPFTKSYLVEAQPVSFDQKVFTIGFDAEFEEHMGLVDNARNHSLLQTKLAELGCPNAQIKFVKTESPARPLPKPVESTPPKPAAPQKSPAVGRTASSAAATTQGKSAQSSLSHEDFKNDPLIQKALEIFRGQIVDVRA